MQTADPVNEHKILQKYAGLAWYDPDEDIIVITSDEKVHFLHQSKPCIHEYHIVALCDGYDPETNPDATDLWVILEGTELYYLFSDWYKKNPDPSILIEEKEGD
eukprot:10829562-Ditylum_brightwellii.AAC.1